MEVFNDLWPTICGWLSIEEAARARAVCVASSQCGIGFDRLEAERARATLARVATGWGSETWGWDGTSWTTFSPEVQGVRGLGQILTYAMKRSLSAARWGSPDAIPRAVWSALNWQLDTDRGAQSVDWAPELLECGCPRCFGTLPCGREEESWLDKADGDYLFYEAHVDLPPWGDGSPWGARKDARTWGDEARWRPDIPDGDADAWLTVFAELRACGFWELVEHCTLPSRSSTQEHFTGAWVDPPSWAEPWGFLLPGASSCESSEVKA